MIQEEMGSFWKCALFAAWLVLQAALSLKAVAVEGCLTGMHDGAGINTAQIVRSKGYIAEVTEVITDDGYILELVRILNPLINGGLRGRSDRRPILFVPGEQASGAVYLAGYEQVLAPKDLSYLDIQDEQVQRSLAKEPSSSVLPLLASDRGHEAWILNRRGISGSLCHTKYRAYKDNNTVVGLTQMPASERCTSNNPETGEYNANEELLSVLRQYASESVDPRYWNYTLDAQALGDLPKMIAHVLSTTGQEKLSLVAWSSGTSMVLMLLIEQPEFSNLVSNAVLLAPTFFRSSAASLQTNSIQSTLANYLGPFDVGKDSTEQVECLVQRACHQTYGKARCDEPAQGPPPGRVGNRPTTSRELKRYSNFPRSAGQITQLQQNLAQPLHFFNYGDRAKNFAAYGQAEPPVYNLSKITLGTISTWSGAFDRVAEKDQIDRLLAGLNVPLDVHFFNQSDIYFDHASVIFHQNVASIVNLPALADIERLSGSTTKTRP